MKEPMPASIHASRTNAKVNKHRAKRRASGLRLIQLWVTDVRSPSFKAEARRQARAVAASPLAAEDQTFVESLADWGDD